MQSTNEEFFFVWMLGWLGNSYKFEIVGLEMVYLKTSDYKVYLYK